MVLSRVNIQKPNKNSRSITITTESSSFKVKNKANISRGAIRELQNPDTIYILGGNPTYIHSTEAYFRTGLKTADKEMERMLSELVFEQKHKMIRRVSYINKRWSTMLSELGYSGSLDNAFNKFQKLWQQITRDGNQNQYLQAIKRLQNLKTSTVMKNEIERIIADNRSGGAQKIQKALDEAGFHIVVSTIQTKSGERLSYNNAELQYYRNQIKQSSLDVLQYIIQHNRGHLDKLYKVVNENIVNQLLNGETTSIDYLTNVQIGNLFELLSEDIISLYGDKIDTLGAPLVAMQIENIAGEKTGKDTKKYKSDSLIHLLNADFSIAIPVSDKTGLVVNHFSKECSVKDKGFIEQFTASLSSSTLDFSNLEVDSEVFKHHQKFLTPLFNYVLRNGAAIRGQTQQIQNFKEMVVCYVGWLKLMIEIVGNPDDWQDMPLAIRTPYGLYNTADLLEKFYSVGAKDLIKGGHFINLEKLKQGFYKNTLQTNFDAVITPIDGAQKQFLYNEKRFAIQDLISKKQDINYINLYNLNTLKSTLSNLVVNSLGKLPAINTWYRINLNNLQQLL